MNVRTVGISTFESYPLPGVEEEYYPDPKRPIERWYNRLNSGNSATVTRIVRDLVGRTPTALIDPFAGAGCSAVAAREMGIPFFGIEREAVLACVAAAKARARPRHVRRLRDHPELLDPAAILDFCRNAVGSGALADDDRVLGSLAVLVALAASGPAPVDLAVLRADLEDAAVSDVPRREERGVVNRGDCRERAAWSGIPKGMRAAVVFTSPPFYRTGLPLDGPAELHAAASLLFPDTTPQNGTADRSGYADKVVGMLRQLTEHLAQGWVVLEHEPGDASPEGLAGIVGRLESETDFAPRRVLETRAFSKAGVLSMVLCERR